MKNKSLFIIIIANLTACNFLQLEDLKNREFSKQNCFDYQPQKEQFTLGDTLWIYSSFPQKLENVDFTVNFSEDSVGVYFNASLVRIDSIYNSNYWFILSNVIVSKTGSYSKEEQKFYYTYNIAKNKYENEFGIILQDTGKFFFAGSEMKTERIFLRFESLPEIIKKSERTGTAFFSSTFISNTKGWFQFEVNP